MQPHKILHRIADKLDRECAPRICSGCGKKWPVLREMCACGDGLPTYDAVRSILDEAVWRSGVINAVIVAFSAACLIIIIGVL